MNMFEREEAIFFCKLTYLLRAINLPIEEKKENIKKEEEKEISIEWTHDKIRQKIREAYRTK